MLFTVCGKMFCSWHFQLPSQLLYQHCLDAQSLLFFLFFAQLCYGFLPHEPKNWKFKRLKFCTLYQCLQSFSPAYTDQWSPQPINSPKGWRGRKKVCTQQQQRLKAWVNNKPLKGPGTGLANPNIHSDLSICKVAYCKDNENHFVIIADYCRNC